MDGPTPRSLAPLMRAVAIAALPASAQEAWLASIGLDWLNVDEIALEVNDGVLLAPQFIAAGWLPSEALGPLTALDAVLESMSGEERSDLWTVTGLRRAPEWSECRTRALAVLLAVN